MTTVRLADIWTIYSFEVRSALRERTIVTNSILMPILLYPFMLWAMFTGIVFVRGQTEGMSARVALRGVPEAHRALVEQFKRDERFTILEGGEAVEVLTERIRGGDVDGLIEFLPASAGAAQFPDNFAVRVTTNDSKERSVAAGERVRERIVAYRDRWLEREAAGRGVRAAEWQQFALEGKNVASSKQMGQFLLGLMLPMFFVIMVAVGCFYPAVDATAGERERNTWETLMSAGASRSAIVVGKYLYVASFGCVAGLLNLIAMTASMRAVLAPLLARSNESLEFSIPPAAVPVMALGAVLLAMFVAAGMMIFASFARTFKDGQSMVTPFYLLVLLPVMFLQVPGIKLTLPLAVIPVVNVAMVVREAISGVFNWPLIGLAVAVEAATVAGCLLLAGFILRFEDVVIGSYSGNLSLFVKERLLGKRSGREVTR